MAPCSGKAKCGCGCPKKKKVARKKAPAKARPQFGGPAIQSFPGMMTPQFTPTLMTPIPSAVSKITGDSIVKKQTAEIGTQTEKQPKPATLKRLKKIVVMPVEEKPPRAMSKAGMAAIARSESARPLQRVNTVVSFAPEEEKPVKVEDIKPRGRPPGRPTKASKIAMSGTQPLISSVLQARQK
jgi:hypothetical protein